MIEELILNGADIAQSIGRLDPYKPGWAIPLSAVIECADAAHGLADMLLLMGLY